MKYILLFLLMIVIWALLTWAVQVLLNINAKRYMRGEKFINLFKNQK
jgi:hypothetical protein